jgi:oligoribonuclease
MLPIFFSRIAVPVVTLSRSPHFFRCLIPKRRMADDTNAHKYQTHPILVWVDCEMTGLQVEKDRLMEIAVILTDSDLNEVESLGPLYIQTPHPVLDNMNDWCKKNHAKSGLTKQGLDSELTIEQADELLFQLLSRHKIKRAGLAGNSVSYDRVFLAKWCPKFR